VVDVVVEGRYGCGGTRGDECDGSEVVLLIWEARMGREKVEGFGRAMLRKACSTWVSWCYDGR
jgi:hypothetical protein